MSHHASRQRRRARFHRRTKPGAAPGALVVDPQAQQPVVHAMCYGPEEFWEGKIDDLDEIPQLLTRYPVTWVNVDGLGSAGTLSEIARIFGLHRLAVEDVVNLHQRAKVEPYEQQLFVVARMARSHGNVDCEQVSIFMGPNYVVTFTEDPGDAFNPVRERLRQGSGKVRSQGPDYLVYSLLDAVIDNYFPLLEQVGERLDSLEDRVLDRPDQATIGRIHDLKHDLLSLRRIIWPHREAVNILCRDPSPLIKHETQIYFRDLYDHVIQIMDLLESYRELGSDLRDAYLASVSNRMNEVMKVLTIIATIFIPLTFITSVYGMNFDTRRSPFNMPELEWRYGYPLIWGIMIAVAGAMLYFFRRQGWLDSFLPAPTPAPTVRHEHGHNLLGDANHHPDNHSAPAGPQHPSGET